MRSFGLTWKGLLRRAPALAAILLSLGLASRQGEALFLSSSAVWVGGTADGHPLVLRAAPAPMEAWILPEPGRVHALARGYAAGEAAGDVALWKLQENAPPAPVLRLGGPQKERATGLVRAGKALVLAGDAGGTYFGPSRGGRDVFALWVDERTQAVTARFHWGSDNDDVLTAVAPAPGGGVYLAGYEEVNEDCIPVAERGFVLRVGPRGLVWAFRFGLDAASRPVALLTDAGGVWVAGQTDGPLFADARGGDDVFLLHLDPAGRVLGRAQWGGPLSDLPVDLLTGPLGQRYLVLESANEQGAFVPRLIRLGPRGEAEAKARLSGPAGAHLRAARRQGSVLWLLFNTPSDFTLETQPWPLR